MSAALGWRLLVGSHPGKHWLCSKTEAGKQRACRCGFIPPSHRANRLLPGLRRVHWWAGARDAFFLLFQRLPWIIVFENKTRLSIERLGLSKSCCANASNAHIMFVLWMHFPKDWHSIYKHAHLYLQARTLGQLLYGSPKLQRSDCNVSVMDSLEVVHWQ